MANGGPIAWRDVVGAVTLRFCADDWALVSDLAIEMDTHPLSRCNAAHVSLDLREDHEALLSATKAETDQTELESRLVAEAETTLDAVDDAHRGARRGRSDRGVARWRNSACGTRRAIRSRRSALSRGGRL